MFAIVHAFPVRASFRRRRSGNNVCACDVGLRAHVVKDAILLVKQFQWCGILRNGSLV